jgi:DNA-binding SARP family transcriptional activator/ABC-type branched-subunit amino acid transport system substrate-binding protein/streptogramin lyase
MRYGILGQLEIYDGPVKVPIGQGHQRLLLAMLLVHANEPVSSERLVDALWTDPPPPTAARSLHNIVSGLRKLLGDGQLVTEAHAYRLRVDDDDLDACRFLAVSARGRAELAAGHPRLSALLLGEALALWRGPVFGDLAAEECLRTEANRLEEHRLTALEDRIEADLALGPHRELVAEIEALVAEHPLRERLRGQQMRALYCSGRQADALAAYTHARQHLVEELGIEPGPALRDVERAVLDQDPALGGAPELATQPSPSARGSPERRPLPILAVGALLLAVSTVAAILISHAGREPARIAAVTGDSLAAIDPASNEVVEQVPVGDTPTRVIAGPGVVWALNADDGTVSRFDLKSKTVGTLSAETMPIDLAADGDELWIAQVTRERDEGSDAVSVTQVDPTSGAGRRTTALPVPGHATLPVLPGELLAAGNHAVWAVARPGWVHRLDVRTGGLTTQRSVQALGIALGDGQVWLRDRSRSAVRLDPTSGRVIATVALPAHSIDALAVGEHAVWLTASQDGTLWRVDPERLTVQTIDVGAGADSVAVGAGAVWVGNSLGGTVTRVDPASNRATATIRVAGTPRGLAIGSGRVWVSLAGTGRAAAAPGGLRPGARVKALPSPPCGQTLTDASGDPDVLIAVQLPLREQVATTLPMTEAVVHVLRERRFRAGRFKVGVQSCDDAIAQTGYSDGPKCFQNARTYAANPAVVGVVGPFVSSCAWLMIPALNRAPDGPLALVSASNSDPGLVRAEPTAPDDVLADLYPAGQHGYARPLPSDDYELAAGAILARRLGDGAVFFLEDREVAAEGLRWVWFRRAAERSGLRIAGRATWSVQDTSFRALVERVRASGVRAVYVNSSVDANVGPLLRELRAGLDPGVAVIGGLPLLPVSDLFAAAGSAARGVFITVPGRTIPGLGARGRRFVREFGATQRGGRVTRLDVYAAAAAEVLLDAIARSDGTRASVTRALGTTQLADSVVGRLALDARGEPIAHPISVVRARDGTGRSDVVQGLDGTVPVGVLTPPQRLVGARQR